MHFRRIRDLREDSDLTQQQVADRLKIAREVYRRYESGERTIPIDCLIELSRLYNKSIDYIVGLKDE